MGLNFLPVFLVFLRGWSLIRFISGKEGLKLNLWCVTVYILQAKILLLFN